MIDYSADGQPIGMELLQPGTATLVELNRLLESLGPPGGDARELAPPTREG